MVDLSAETPDEKTLLSICLLCFRLSITSKNWSIYLEIMHLYTFMNSSCCYSSSNSPSLRFFDLHTVRHFAVKISCLGNIILPFGYPAFPNQSRSQSPRCFGQRNDQRNGQPCRWPKGSRPLRTRLFPNVSRTKPCKSQKIRPFPRHRITLR